MAGERVIDGPRPEDGTDFSSYAAGASPFIARYDRSPLVVAGHADYAGARPDRSRRKAAMRFLCPVPWRADALGPDHPNLPRTDRAGSGAARQDHRLRADLFDRERPRPGSGAGRQGGAEGDPGDLALQQP